MKKIALHSRVFDERKLKYVRQIFSELERYESIVYISEALLEHAKAINYLPQYHQVFKGYEDFPEVDYCISVGGDGTFLEAVTLVREKNIPILGINTGRLGFLAMTSKDEIPQTIEALFNGYYKVDERTLIQLDSDRELFDGVKIALNEFAIMKRDTSSMIVVHTYIDGEYLNSYWADGLIISTPTGSTGYSLSVGGPVVVPHSGNFIIAPVSPHNLNVRPLIVPDSSVIAFEIEGRSKNFLISMDSRSEKVDASVQMAIRKCDYYSKVIQMNGQSFLSTLRQKLNWGNDLRNYQERM